MQPQRLPPAATDAGALSSRAPAWRPGRIALASLLFPELLRAAAQAPAARAHPALPGLPHFAPKARRLIYLFMNGAPSQIDLWDYKPKLADLFDTDLPDSIRKGQRLTTMTSGQKRFPDRALDLQVRPARPVRHAGQRTAAAHRAGRGRPGRDQDASTPRPSTTTRPRLTS